MASLKEDDRFTVYPFVPGYRPKEPVLRKFVRPQDGKHSGNIVESGATGVAAAVQSSKFAFQKFRVSTIHARIALLRRAAEALRDVQGEIASLICEDIGKPIRAATFEANRGSEFIEACVAAASEMRGEVLPLDSSAAGRGLTGFTKRVPYGVIGGITPFNAPVNLLLQKVAPAIAVGNSIVIKPALSGSRVAVRLANLFLEAGWPEGLFNVATGDRESALALAAHPDVAAVSFTGGTAAGNDLIRAAGAKKFVAELGSNAANVVLADANIEIAATKIASAGFEASGQQCISAQRVLVQRTIMNDFVRHLTSAAKAMNVGLAIDPATDIGPMVHFQAADRVMAIVEDAVAKGASVALKPERVGATVSPGILVDTARNSRLWTEEVFGPIVAVVPFGTIDEAIELANDSAFGLQGAVFTDSLAHAFRFAEEMEVGALWINEASRFRLDMYPFGGVKESGIGREGVTYAMEELSQIKFIGIRPSL
jgi:acyl-CoA reductase-like NAD-dependent aldehyde dehydrogenase